MGTNLKRENRLHPAYPRGWWQKSVGEISAIFGVVKECDHRVWEGEKFLWTPLPAENDHTENELQKEAPNHWAPFYLNQLYCDKTIICNK